MSGRIPGEVKHLLRRVQRAGAVAPAASEGAQREVW